MNVVVSDEPFRVLAAEAKELYLPVKQVDRISVPVDVLTFHREYVAKNRPVIIEGALDDWPALGKWNKSYLASVLGSELVTIDVTPDGLGDAVVDGKWFVTPVEKKMTFREFVQILDRNTPKRDGVHYCQHQNSSFSQEYKALADDIKPSSLSFAARAFGSAPDATNFWMGSSAAKSSLHSDPYENIYCVISGEKHFTLYPPTDLPWLGRRWFKAARYEQKLDGQFQVVPETPERLVPWFAFDAFSSCPTASSSSFSSSPKLAHASPLRICVRPGEVLYLPSLWYHAVAQKEDQLSGQPAIAVNFWFDMQFDIKYAYFKFMEAVLGKSDPLVLHPRDRNENRQEQQNGTSLFEPSISPQSLGSLVSQRQDCTSSSRHYFGSRAQHTRARGFGQGS
eukprot:gb/GEZN01008590.1/.p1 GENE.gb/GEZN01008590.1/~~gb/GEZN01008590.1/.p1  ORF type:complete len:395 (+),score=60.56 gb/GEZN01008590.1/:33-1217(+)